MFLKKIKISQIIFEFLSIRYYICHTYVLFYLDENRNSMKMNLPTIAASLTLALLSCTDKGSIDIPVNDWPWGDGKEETLPPADTVQKDTAVVSFVEPNQEYVDAGWVNVRDEYGELPSHINVYRSPEKLENKSVVAYIAVADMSAAKWDVWSVKADNNYKTSDSYKTPSQVYEDTEASIIINGGYFHYSGGNYTSSLAVSDGKVMAYNINYASEDWVTIYNPTRAAFLQKADGKFDACWTYWTGSVHYTYQIPADNSYDEAPQPVPSATFPGKGVKFAAQTAIGGGPVLINSGEVVNTWSEEMFEVGGVNPTLDNPRTALGTTADSRLIFFVCEGRNMTEGVAGLTTADVAEVLLDLGCVEAINLDGGGSTCMLVNGKETIKVSDGSQRSVASTVMMF